jgi:PAS domain-containing protein
MSVPRPLIDEGARAALDAIPDPLSVATAHRDADGRLVNFRLAFANLAAARWSGLEREAIGGRMALDLLPELGPTGLFDALGDVVETGRPLLERGIRYSGSVTGGNVVDGTYELGAVRLGDGYVSAWRSSTAEQPSSGEALDLVLERARSSIRLIRLEASNRRPRLRLHRWRPGLRPGRATAI